MAVKNCAWVKTDSTSEYAYGIIVVDENDFDYLSGIWQDFYPGDYIVWQDTLIPSPGYEIPVGEGWRREMPQNTWFNPNAIPASADEQ